MKIKDILIDWLKSHNYDGLCNQEINCGCGLDDFMPCDEIGVECEPAKKEIAIEDDEEYGNYKIGDEVFVPIREKEND